MIEHGVCIDGSKVTRDHAYRVLATKRNYFDCDVDHESHYTRNSKEHLLYKVNKVSRLDDWVFHPSFFSTEAGKKKKKKKSSDKSQKPDWQRNFHDELKVALRELEEAKKEVVAATGYFWNSSNRQQLAERVTQITEQVEFLKNKIQTAAKNRFKNKNWVKKQVATMKKAGGIKVSPDGKSFVFLDQEAFGGEEPLLIETNPERAEAYMLYFLKDQETKKELESHSSQIVESEPLLVALHDLTGVVAEAENEQALDDFMRDFYQWRRFQTAEPKKGSKKSSGTGQGTKFTEPQLKIIADFLQHVTENNIVTDENMRQAARDLKVVPELAAKDVLQKGKLTTNAMQKVLEAKREYTKKFSDYYENSSAGKIMDRVFTKWLGDDEIKASTKSDPRNLKEQCNWVNIRYKPAVEEAEEAEEAEEDEEDGYNTDDTDVQEPHLNEPFNDKRLYKPCIKHPKSPDARQTFLNEDLSEKRIYKLPFKSLTPEEAQKNYAQRNHFCYDSVALSDYIVHKITSILNPDLSDTLFTRTTNYDPKCKRNINVYRSTKKWQIGKAEERYLSFTDYEFSDLMGLIAHIPEVFTDVIKNPAWDQSDLISLQPQMTEYLTPNILCNALQYFKGYHDILVITRGGEALNNPKIRQQIEAISAGEYVNPFAGTEFDRPDENAAEVSYLTSTWNKIKNLGYALYSSVISFTVNAFDFMKAHFAKIQAFYSILCAGAFVWVASTLFATGGWLAMLSSPAVRAGTVNILTQALNSKILLSMFNFASGFGNRINEFSQDVTSNRLQTWFQWTSSWTPWLWSKVTGIPFDKCLNIFTKMGNLMWKYGPTKLFALYAVVNMVYLSGVVLKRVGTAASVIPHPAAMVGGPIVTLIGSIVGGIASFLRELTPVLSYLMYMYELFDFFVSKAATITTFVSTIFTGEMTPLDAVITFKYIPKMLCSWSMPADSKLLTHCNKFAFIIEQSAWLAIISGFVLDVLFDVLFFTGLGGSPGRCGKIVSSFKTSRDKAIAQAEKDGAARWYRRGKTTKEKEQMARDSVFGKQFRDTHQNPDTISGRLGGLLNPSDISAPPAYPTTDPYAYVQQETKPTYTQWVKK